jgi:glycosyltransferase involved in cell wall biosynthesis
VPDQSLLIYIPSYNARPFLERTVSRIPWNQLPPQLSYSVLFVDNASPDGTAEIIPQARESLSAIGIPSDAILHPVNRGYGGSVKSALKHAFEHGHDFLAVLHADGQYAPEKLPELISALLAEPRAALHFGSRLTGDALAGRMPLYKFLANHVLSGLQNLCSGLHLSEYHSGYKLYRLSHIARIPWQRLSDGFVIDNEIIFMIQIAGFRITEGPIPTHYGEEKSHVPNLGTPLAILRNLAVYVLARTGLRRDPLYERMD